MSRISTKKNTPKEAPQKRRRALGLFCLFLLLAATLVAGFYFMVLYPGTIPKNPVPLLGAAAKQDNLPAPLHEESTLTPQTPPVVSSPKNTLPARPLVAIVIDDMGYRQDTGRALLALDLPLSFSFLPFTPFSEELQKKAHDLGRDIILHLPLEPVDPKWNPGPGTLTTAMDPGTIQTIFRQDLQAVPKAIGVSNHMGSRFTANPQAMQTLLPLVRQHQLFFLDSVTSAQSVAYDLARSMGIKAERRTVFLDNHQDPDKIIAQLDLLVQLAGKHGQAVGIGHPYPATVEALRRYQSQLRTSTEMVGISRLVH